MVFWAARYNTGLLIKLTPSVVFFFSFFPPPLLYGVGCNFVSAMRVSTPTWEQVLAFKTICKCKARIAEMTTQSPQT